MTRESYSVKADRGIEEGKRRRLGEFYTPLKWVDEGYKVIERRLGKGWEKRYTVWDSSCGTGNLTKGKGIEKLYNSTLIAEDFGVGEVDGVYFQYDFLNDDVEIFEQVRARQDGGLGYMKAKVRETKLYKEAPGLVESMERGEPILFLINPPYRAANNMITRVRGEDVQVTGGNKTAVREVMRGDRTKLGVGQLYAQFLYRIHLLQEIYPGEFNIALYSKQRVITAEMMSGLRDVMYKDFTVSETFSFQASHFSGCSGKWAVLFSMWESKSRGAVEDTRTVLKDIVDGEVESIGKQLLYTVEPGESLQDWVVEGLEGEETTNDAVYLSNGFKAYHKPKGNGRVVDGFLGGYFSKSNVVEKNNNFVVLTSELMGDGSSKNITEKNIDRVVSSFAARKLMTGRHANWKVDALEYMQPDESHNGYREWLNDSLIFSIFHNDSYQTSIRGMEYNGKKWDIQNEFFFMSQEEIKEAAEKEGLNRLVEDIEQQGKERYMYKRIKEVESVGGFSKEAQELLDVCRKMLLYTMGKRAESEESLELHSWDAGWIQVKKILSEEQYKEYYARLTELEDKMRPGVYELGFLKK